MASGDWLPHRLMTASVRSKLPATPLFGVMALLKRFWALSRFPTCRRRMALAVFSFSLPYYQRCSAQ
jgi:hypothetical protein